MFSDLFSVSTLILPRDGLASSIDCLGVVRFLSYSSYEALSLTPHLKTIDMFL